MMSSRGAQFAIMISLALAATDTLGAGFAKAEEIVTVGVNGLISDAPFYIGQSKSYFAQQGIALKLVPIDAGTRMIAPLSIAALAISTRLAERWESVSSTPSLGG